MLISTCDLRRSLSLHNCLPRPVHFSEQALLSLPERDHMNSTVPLPLNERCLKLKRKKMNSLLHCLLNPLNGTQHELKLAKLWLLYAADHITKTKKLYIF